MELKYDDSTKCSFQIFDSDHYLHFLVYTSAAIRTAIGAKDGSDTLLAWYTSDIAYTSMSCVFQLVASDDVFAFNIATPRNHTIKMGYFRGWNAIKQQEDIFASPWHAGANAFYGKGDDSVYKIYVDTLMSGFKARIAHLMLGGDYAGALYTMSGIDTHNALGSRAPNIWLMNDGHYLINSIPNDSGVSSYASDKVIYRR